MSSPAKQYTVVSEHAKDGARVTKRKGFDTFEDAKAYAVDLYETDGSIYPNVSEKWNARKDYEAGVFSNGVNKHAVILKTGADYTKGA